MRRKFSLGSNPEIGNKSWRGVAVILKKIAGNGRRDDGILVA